jgi:hypothetical protein
MTRGAAVIRSGIVPLASTQGSSLLAIVEAKSPIDWEAARARLAAQCIAMLKSTCVHCSLRLSKYDS